MACHIIYCRKSSESEERQVLSIESQIKELNDLTQRLKIPVSEVLTESRSAKYPGRPVFGRLMERVSRGEIKGIVTWKLDRLARNPIDGAALIWALDQNKVEEFITPSNNLRNNSNDKFLMQIEFGMAKKYVDDLSDNVKRGNRMKLEKGWLPGLAPIGYLNEPKERTIVPDPDKFTAVRKMWDLLLQRIPPAKIRRIASEEWGLRGNVCRSRVGRPMCMSAIYKVFTNPFYYGIIDRREGVFRGNHKAMISEGEYWEAQKVLGLKGKPRPRTRNFAFTGLIRCGECGSSITAEEKTNRYGSRYIYYHCTRKNPGLRCGQRVIRLEQLEAQIIEYLSRIFVPDKLLAMFQDYLRKENEHEQSNETQRKHSIERVIADCQRRLENLNQMRLKDLIDDEEYMREKRKLLDEKIQTEGNLATSEEETEHRQMLTAETLQFAHTSVERFKSGSLEEKRAILEGIGSNLTLKGQKLFIQPKKPFLILEELLLSTLRKTDWLEPDKGAVDAGKTPSFVKNFHSRRP